MYEKNIVADFGVHRSLCANEANGINDTNWPAYRCGIGSITKEEFLECVNGSI